MDGASSPMSYHWSVHQLTEYLVQVSGPREQSAATDAALEHAIEALDAELGVVMVDNELRASLGFGRQEVPQSFFGSLRDNEAVEVHGIGRVFIARGDLDKAATRGTGSDGYMLLGRIGREFTAEESQLLQGMALTLGLVLHNLSILQAERSRHRLVETLLDIQKAISARRPLNEVLDAITEGAWELLGRCPVALLLVDPTSPELLRPHSLDRYSGFDDETVTLARAALADDGGSSERFPLQAHPLLAAQVVVSGETAGCLIARPASQAPGQRDQAELLNAFAQQVSLALNDARTVDAVRKASRDPITGLPNRAHFLQRLEQERRTAVADNADLTVLFIDLDRFKAVNDTLGHQVGDELLAEVSRRIITCIRPTDIVARLGGDEFAVALAHTGLESGRGVASRIVRALANPFAVSGREVLVGASIGIATSVDRHHDASALLGEADIAMYRAKRSGRGRCVVFEPYMQEEVADRLDLFTDLQRLATNGQLWLAYQPILSLASLEVEGVEALMRWSHPARGLVPPSVFIPAAEETDLILELGAQVIGRGLADMASWSNRSTGLTLNLNISARQIVDGSLPDIVSEALASNRVPPEFLTLEITESSLIEDPELARARLTRLKDIGVKISIDDFGTGYSSLSYLRQYPVDQVKVDRSFIAELRDSATNDIALARSIIELCQRLRIETVAEGVETDEQLRLLRELGCDLGQGYLFAHPMAAPDWLAWKKATASGRRLTQRHLVSAGS
jgi:diguanylate cyclase (GGDEF)-like protein